MLGVLQPPQVISAADYLQLLDWAGRQLAPGKRGRITGGAPACRRGIGGRPKHWTGRVRSVERVYWRVVDSAEQLIWLAMRIGRRWLKGFGFAERLSSHPKAEAMWPERELRVGVCWRTGPRARETTVETDTFCYCLGSQRELWASLSHFGPKSSR